MAGVAQRGMQQNQKVRDVLEIYLLHWRVIEGCSNIGTLEGRMRMLVGNLFNSLWALSALFFAQVQRYLLNGKQCVLFVCPETIFRTFFHIKVAHVGLILNGFLETKKLADWLVFAWEQSS